jgi:hypothetical protein
MISPKLDPNVLPKQTGGLKAERTLHRVTPSSAKPGETLYVSVPNLAEGVLLVPGTLGLRFDLAVQPTTTDERCLVNNIGRNIVSQMKIKFAGENLLDLSRYDLYKTYGDLFLDPYVRNRIEQGIGGKKLRQVRTPTKTAPTSVAAETAIKTAYGTK